MTLRQDHEALRHGAGARLVARDAVSVRGPDARSYLQGQCSQDVDKLAVGSSVDALLLSPQGKLEALVRVTRRAEDAFLLDVEGGWGAIVRTRLERFKLRVDAEVEDLAMGCLSMRGPQAPELAPRLGGALVVGFEWNGLGGVDVLGGDVDESVLAALEGSVRRCGSAAWQSVRVEAGIPAMGAELDGRTIAAEAGLLERTVSFTKGCYTGQELVARLDARGNKVARRLVGLVLGRDEPAPLPDGPASADAPAPIAPGSEVLDGADGTVVGAVTSSAWSPALGAVALAYVHRRVTPPAPVRVRLSDDRLVAAQARTLPLVA